MNANSQDNQRPSGRTDERLGESFWRELADLFHSRQRWIMVLMFIYAWAFFGVAIWMAVAFFCSADTVKEQIMYATIFIASIVFLGLLKFAFWLFAAKMNILKAIRRLEGRIDQLARK